MKVILDDDEDNEHNNDLIFGLLYELAGKLLSDDEEDNVKERDADDSDGDKEANDNDADGDRDNANDCIDSNQSTDNIQTANENDSLGSTAELFTPLSPTPFEQNIKSPVKKVNHTGSVSPSISSSSSSSLSSASKSLESKEPSTSNNDAYKLLNNPIDSFNVKVSHETESANQSTNAHRSQPEETTEHLETISSTESILPSSQSSSSSSDNDLQQDMIVNKHLSENSAQTLTEKQMTTNDNRDRQHTSSEVSSSPSIPSSHSVHSVSAMTVDQSGIQSRGNLSSPIKQSI
ncbi:unnamed protein product [Trichobilharzia regenti]|nr:unnamed protein product [Trichobilharzia regenti]